jgi:anti-sigma factor ChrR (cupin superfamily)
LKLHADLTARAVVDSNALPWLGSPASGVERRMLERDGEEVARATSLVRFAPGSSFSAHTHGGGEEFLVLSGIFSDETGDFPAGYYVRNPPGSHHAPSSGPGAVIFVKLRQMHPSDDQLIHVDTRDAARWRSSRAGEEVMALFEGPHETVGLVRWAAGSFFPEAELVGGAEYFVLNGAFADDQGTYGAGTWLRLPAGSSQRIRTESGATVYRKTGHLALCSRA